MRKYAVIGFGCAGYHAVRSIRSVDPDGWIDVYSDSQEPPSNPMLTTYYASGQLNYEGAFPFGSMDELLAGFRFHLMPAAYRVDAETRTVYLTDGSAHSYDRLLVSTGAAPIIPPLPGLGEDNTFCMRTMKDAKRLKQYLGCHKVDSAVVVGASMVGIKVVELLTRRGIRVTLNDMAPHIFPLAAYPDVASVIEKRLGSAGIRFKFGCGLAGVRQDGGIVETGYSDKSSLRSELLVLCIGVRPNLSMLIPGQLETGRGITVNDRMETSAPGVFAAGDCCESVNLLDGGKQMIGLWANAGLQGETAGLNMAGKEAVYDGSIPHNITHFMNMDFIGVGDNRIQGDKTIVCGDPDGGLFVKAVIRDGKIYGCNILDHYRISGLIRNYIFKRCRGGTPCLADYQRQLLLQEGLTDAFIDALEGCCDE